MKKILFLSLLILLGFSACDKQTFDPVLNIGAGPEFTAPTDASSYVVTEENIAGDIMTTFSWSASDYGFSAAVDYALEMDTSGNDFADATELVNAADLSYEVTYSKINALLLAKAYESEVPVTMEFRVRSIVSDQIDDLFSSTLTLTISPFEQAGAIEYPALQVPGSYQGWDPGSLETQIYDRNFEEKYAGYAWIGDAELNYKFAQGNSWAVNWGDDAADGNLQLDGANIVLTEPGMYQLNVDLTALTHTSLKTDWGLIGTATPGGWDTDTDMTYDEVKRAMSITLDLVAGEMKFRANDDWVINFGDDNANGFLQQDGANIMLTEDGNYTVDLYLSDSEYKYVVTKN